MKSALRFYRKKAGFTLDSLAKKSGIGRSTIGHVETGHLAPSDDFLEKISKTLGVSIENLVNFPPSSSEKTEVAPCVGAGSVDQGNHSNIQESSIENWQERALRAETRLEVLITAMQALLNEFKQQKEKN
ncbi:MAG: helix-turn-helix transcriptional regulator [Chthoniobacteraceae bacterium]|nr:helix-turn-helix transcriptional regulator [Chthoniobacteraceae bacterium]